MPDTVLNDKPAVSYHISKQNAVAMAKQSWAKRRAKAATATAEAMPYEGFNRFMTAQCQATLAALLSRLCASTVAQDSQGFASAFGRVFEVWQVLTQTPSPGAFKHTLPPANRRSFRNLRDAMVKAGLPLPELASIATTPTAQPQPAAAPDPIPAPVAQAQDAQPATPAEQPTQPLPAIAPDPGQTTPA